MLYFSIRAAWAVLALVITLYQQPQRNMGQSQPRVLHLRVSRLKTNSGRGTTSSRQISSITDAASLAGGSHTGATPDVGKAP